MFIKTRFLKEHSLFSKYVNYRRGVWDKEKYNFLLNNLCLDFKNNGSDEKSIMYEMEHIYYEESGFTTFIKIKIFIDDLINMFNEKYGIKLDLHNQVTFLSSEALS